MILFATGCVQAQESVSLNKSFGLIKFGNLSFISPIKDAQITSPFGYRTDAKVKGSKGGGDSIHMGLDLIPPKTATPKEVLNQKILAAEDGEVIVVYPPPSKKFRGHVLYGGCVQVRHLIGQVGERKIYAYTLYGHMKAVWVKEKMMIKKGDTLGIMGSTGQSTGPHLHFEILFDPMDLLNNEMPDPNKLTILLPPLR